MGDDRIACLTLAALLRKSSPSTCAGSAPPLVMGLVFAAVCCILSLEVRVPEDEDAFDAAASKTAALDTGGTGVAFFAGWSGSPSSSGARFNAKSFAKGGGCRGGVGLSTPGLLASPFLETGAADMDAFLFLAAADMEGFAGGAGGFAGGFA